ncbi:MAG: recombination factor protein RarA, partial [Macromonas sp.]
YLAVAPKSNAAYVAWQQAKAFVRQDGSRPVPVHLRNASTALMRQLGHGAAYRYPHDEPEGYAAGERYWPDGVAPPTWYQPTPRGLEIKIADKLARLRALDEAAATSAKLK